MDLTILTLLVLGLGIIFGTMWLNEKRKNRSGKGLLKVSIASFILSILLIITIFLVK